MKLECDPQRLSQYKNDSTGIFVRAKDPTDDKFINADILWLTKESLVGWLKSRGGDNQWAENAVLLLLGHSI